MKLIAEPRIAAMRTHVFATSGSIGYHGAEPLHAGGRPIPKPKRASAAPPVRVPKRPTPPDRIPPVIAEPTLDDHLAVISRAVFQAGLSWAFIDATWDAYLAAFEGFHVAAVAAYGDDAIERLMSTERLVHSRAKIAGTIRNARTLLEIAAEFGSIAAYQASFGTDYAAARKDAARRFAFMGDLNTYYWRFRTGAAVPELETWMQEQQRDHPRMREMVLATQRSA
jgi:3-methyladenine DNA glycosylase Tag